MSLAIPVEQCAIANNTTKFSDQEIWSALIEVEKTLPIDIGLDYFIGNQGKLSLYAKNDDKWIGHQYFSLFGFSLFGVENLTKYFTNLLSEHRKVAV